MNLGRLDFIRGCAALLAAAPGAASIDWSFPGVLGAYARRLADASPFAQHAAERVMPAASTIKLVVALAAVSRMEREGLSWSHPLPLRAADVVAGSETFGNDRGGEMATIASLAAAMIEQSDNTAANALLDWLGYERIDAAAAAAGMDGTAMNRRFMDFAARAAGLENTTTARDMATLLCGLGNGTRLGFAGASADGCRRIVGFMLRQEDRDTIPAALPGRTVANKTGVLQGVRHDVAIVDFGAPGAYAVALLSMDDAGEANAGRRLREIAAQIDARR